MIGVQIVKPKAKLITPEEWFEKIPWLVEYCGRLSHKSEGRMAEGSADPFIRKVARRLGHESITEHMVITYHVWCDRSCSHQLVRHRLAAYTQESQRYCSYAKGGANLLHVILPPSIGDLPEGTIIREDHEYASPALHVWADSTLNSYKDYLFLIDQKIPPEDARSVLHNATKTELAVTFNLRMWRHVFEQRALNRHAQWQIRSVFSDILQDLARRLPMFFDDLLVHQELRDTR